MKFFYKLKFSGKPALLLLTFVIGTIAVKLWLEIFPPIVSLFEVANNIERYEGQKVRLLAEAHSSGGMVILDDFCYEKNSFAFISLPEDYQPSSVAVQDFISQENLNLNTASILITGRIDSKTKYQCHAPKFVIKTEEIELISQVSVESNRVEVEN